MDKPENPNEDIEFKARFSLLDVNNTEADGGEARLTMDAASLGLTGPRGKTRYIPLRDILETRAAEYTVIIALSTSEKLTISQLGHDFENFQRELSQRIRDLTLTDLLMQEPLKMGELHAAYRYIDAAGAEKQAGNCELRIYQTALIVVPELNIPMRLTFSEISAVINESYSVEIQTENSGKYIFTQLGRDLEPLTSVLGEQIRSMDLQVQALVKELMPGASMPAIRTLATLMKEGRAARRKDIEAVGPGLWAQLELQLTGADGGDEYSFLKSIGQAQDICIGVKRGLKADEGNYLWFLVPVFDTDPTKPGNAVIMEAISAEGESRATYVFRMVSRKDYPSFKTIGELQSQMADFIRTVNHALIAINFRREPIYLTDEMLVRPQYEKYRYSIARIPELRALRRLYVGRVIHSTQEQWRADIKDVLSFNVKTQDDTLPWVKSETTPDLP